MTGQLQAPALARPVVHHDLCAGGVHVVLEVSLAHEGVVEVPTLAWFVPCEVGVGEYDRRRRPILEIDLACHQSTSSLRDR